MSLAEDQQMDNVVKWFQAALELPEDFPVKDVHTQKNYQRNLQGVNITLTGGADISIGVNGTECVWIETKKRVKDFNEGQAIGELFLLDKIHPTTAMTVLTDCNNGWSIYYFMTMQNKEQCIVICKIHDRSIALAIIKEFVLEGEFLFGEMEKAITFNKSLTVPAPLKKKAKFLECKSEADNE